MIAVSMFAVMVGPAEVAVVLKSWMLRSRDNCLCR